MRIVRYKARTMPEALRQVRNELGPDAVILSTRTLPPRLRWLGREQVEVVAAAGPQLSRTPEERAPGATAQGPAPRAQGAENSEQPAASGGNGQRLGGALPAEPRTASAAPPVGGIRTLGLELRTAPSEVADLHREIREIRETLGRLMVWTAPKDDLAETLVVRLVERGMSADLARELTKNVAGQAPEAAWAEVLAAAAARIRVSGPLMPAGERTQGEDKRLETRDQRPETAAGKETSGGTVASPNSQISMPLYPRAPQDGPLVVALVGPTGVGKTTTIAKLAARHAIMERRRVALVTLDTYRVAAVDQIRTYAQMLDVPLEVVVSPDDADAIKARLRDQELVLVDTIGHGPNDEMQLGQLRMLLASMNPHQVHLVLAAPTDRRTLQNAVERFSRLGPTHLLFTKVDEAAVFGGMVDIAVRSEWPVSYVSYGQDVPESIAPAAAEKLAAAVCQEEQ